MSDESIPILQLELDSGTRRYSSSWLRTSDLAYWAPKIKAGGLGTISRSVDFTSQVMSPANTSVTLLNDDREFSQLMAGEVLIARTAILKHGLSHSLDISEFEDIFQFEISGVKLVDRECTLELVDQTFSKLKNLPNFFVTKELFPNAPADSYGRLLPIPIGHVFSQSGAIKAVLVDRSVGFGFGGWAVAGCPIKAVREVYVGGVLRDPSEYVSVVSHRYTDEVVGGTTIPRSVAGVLPLVAWGEQADVRVNVYGIETNDNGTGELITNPAQVIYHLLTKPRYWGLGEERIDFDAYLAAYYTFIERGYTFSGIIPPSGSQQEATELLAQMMGSCASEFYWSRSGKFSIRVPPTLPVMTAETPKFTAEHEILTGSFSQATIQDIINSVRVFYGRNPSAQSSSVDTEWEGFITVESRHSIQQLGDKRYEQDLLLWFVSQERQAIDVACRWLFRHQHSRLMVTFSLPITLGQNLEVTQTIAVSHPLGVELTDGWFDHLLYIVGLSVNVSDSQVEVTAFDWTTQGRGFIIGPSQVEGTTWPPASELQQYGYLCNRDTGKFSNGDLGKLLLE